MFEDAGDFCLDCIDKDHTIRRLRLENEELVKCNEASQADARLSYADSLRTLDIWKALYAESAAERELLIEQVKQLRFRIEGLEK